MVRVHAEERCGECRRSVDQLVAMVAFRDQSGLEQMTDDTVGELTLELRAAPAQHSHSCRGRGPLPLQKQPRLADAARSLDNPSAPRPVGASCRRSRQAP